MNTHSANSNGKDSIITTIICLISLFLVGQFLVTLLFGLPLTPKISPDSRFYLNAASNFPSLQGNQLSYSGYIFYLHICQFFGFAPGIALIFNSVAVLLSSLALKQITEYWSDSRAGWISAAILLVNPITAQWTRYVLTEPIFYSSVILWLWLALFRPGWYFLLFSCFAATLRPNGFTLILSACLWIIYLNKRHNTFSSQKYLVALSILSLVIACSIAAPLVFYELGKASVLIEKGVVIFGFSAWDLPMDGPLSWIRLMITRLIVEFAQVRPYYSLKYNLYNGLFMAFFYISAVRGLLQLRRSLLLKATLVVSLPSIAIIASTWAIHEGRFAWWVLVAWIPVVAIGCQHSKSVRHENLL